MKQCALHEDGRLLCKDCMLRLGSFNGAKDICRSCASSIAKLVAYRKRKHLKQYMKSKRIHSYDIFNDGDF
jgi:hypothetical protein